MINIKNKKGDNRILSIWFFLVLTIIAVGIAAGHYIYYSDPIEVKYDEAKILSNRIIDSVVLDGYLNFGILEDNFDIFKESGINPEMFYDEGNFYFEVVILKDGEVIKEIASGNRNIRVESQINGNNFARGYYDELDILNKKDNAIYKIKVLTASKQDAN